MVTVITPPSTFTLIGGQNIGRPLRSAFLIIYTFSCRRSGLNRHLLIYFRQWELTSEGDCDSLPRLLSRLIGSLPPTNLALKLIDLFFTNVNIHFPLLHKPTFERQWREGLQFRDPWFSCLCLTVFAVSSRWCNDVGVLPDEDLTTTAGQSSEKIEWRRAGYKYFEACLREFHFMIFMALAR